MNEGQYVNFQHDGECYKNSKLGPSVAEEFDAEQVDRQLLFDFFFLKMRKFLHQRLFLMGIPEEILN